MREWYGAATVCVNEKNEVLMIKSYGSEAWAVPSGGIEPGETAAECCVREVMEETGYHVKVKQNLFI
ncbi:NUDIX domain-containing protein [Exiguobacterium sp. S90]|uniref:NUDIX hydrolase n=1 Tax=Exiguobacterium sp. S90 TaxID=1221231 RepID=UPI001BE89362